MTVFSVHFDLQAPNAVKQLLGLIDLYRPNNIYRQLKSVNRSPICPRLKAAAALCVGVMLHYGLTLRMDLNGILRWAYCCQCFAFLSEFSRQR